MDAPRRSFRAASVTCGVILALLGSSVRAHAQTLLPATLSFGNQVVGQPSAGKNETFRNTLATPITISSIAMSGSNAGDFGFTTTCPVPPATLAPNKTCTVTVVLTASAVAPRNATLTIGHSSSASPQSVALTGTGINPVSLTPATSSFGNLAQGTTGTGKTVTLTNVQTAVLSIHGITLGNNFVRTGGSCPVGAGTLAGGASCTVIVAFAPSVVGQVNETLTVTHSALNTPLSVGLSGTGIAPVTLSANTLSFATTAVGNTSAPKSVTLTNKKNVPLNFSSISTTGDFVITSNPCGTSIAAGAACAVGVSFVPTAANARSGSLIFADNAANSPQTVTLGGTGILPVKTMPAAGLTFAARSVGTTSGPSNITVTNQLTSVLTVSGAAATGDFAVTSNTCGGVAAGATCTIGVTFTPTAVGPRAGTIALTHNAFGSPTIVTVSGTGNANGLNALAITPASSSLGLGLTRQFTATGTFTGGRTANLTTSVAWTSSVPGVATISNAAGTQGLATSVAAGTSTISATLNTVTGSTSLTIAAPTLVSIAVTPTNPSIPKGLQQDFTATGTYTNGSTQDLTGSSTWSSSTTSVATISNAAGSKGRASSVTVGSTTIQATVGSTTGSTTLTVLPPVVVSLLVSPVNPTLVADGTIQLTAIASYSDGGAQDVTSASTWTSENPAAATVGDAPGSKGLMNGVASGLTTITATLGSVSRTLPVTVTGSTRVARFAFVAGDFGMNAYTVDAITGEFTEVPNSPITQNVGTRAIAVHPRGRFVYVGAGSCCSPSTDVVTAFAVDPASGALSPVPGSPFEAGQLPLGLVMHRNGRFLYAANRVSNNISAYSIDQTTGALAPLAGSPFATINSLNAATATADGRFLYVASDGGIAGYSIDQNSGSLAALPGSPFGAGIGTFSILAEPLGRFVYVGRQNGIAVFSLTSSGALVEIPGSPFGAPPNRMGVDPSGSFILGTATGVTNGVSVYAINQMSGALTEVAGSPFATGEIPREVAVDPSGRFVYVANQAGQELSAFSLDAVTGALSPLPASPIRTARQPFSIAMAGMYTEVNAQPTSLAVVPSAASSPAGVASRFAARVNFTDGSSRFLTASSSWTSSPASVATVSNATGTKGAATGSTVGTATISASYAGLTGSGTLTVAPAVLSTIVVTPENPTIPLGAVQQFAATGVFTDGTTVDMTASVTWGSSNPPAATVSNTPGTKGRLTTVAQGTTVVFVTTGAFFGTTTVTIGPPLLASIAVTPANPSVVLGGTQQFTATGTYGNGSTQDLTAGVTWASSTPATATIAAGGLATSVAQGTTLITASSGAVSGSTTLTVTPPASLVSITVTPSSQTAGLGIPTQYTATATYSNGSTADITAAATWTVGNRAFASATSSGEVMALATGTTAVIAQSGTVTGAGHITGLTMTHARQQAATATLLLSGQVLIAGGIGNDGITANAELFDPVTGLFSVTGSLARPRYLHTATRLPDGRVLVTGGVDANAVNTAEIYDPAAGTWTTVPTPMTTARYYHTATLVGTRVLLAGGFSTTTNQRSAELFDPATATFSAVGNMTMPRYLHTATLLSDGRVLVVGGYSNSQQASAELYNPATATWTATGSMTIARAYHTATLLATNEVLVVGTTESAPRVGELYNLASGTWRATGTVTGAREGHTATLLPTGQVLVAGGNSSDAAELYDPTADQFVLASNLAYRRSFHSATQLGNGSVLLAGGTFDASAELRTVSGVLSSLAVTGPSTVHVGESAGYRAIGTFTNGSTADVTSLVTWSASPASVAAGGAFGGVQAVGAGTATISAASGATTASALLIVTQVPTSTISGITVTGLAHMRQQGATATLLLSGQVLIVGGIDGGGSTASAELFDPVTGLFSVTGSLARARYFHTATLLPDGRVLVTGGVDANAVNTAEIYDPATGAWTIVPTPMTTPRYYHTATLVGTRVLVAGGFSTTSPLRSAELFDPATGTFSAVGNMTMTRYLHTATLLPNGRVLAAGGYSNSQQASAELYDPTTATWVATGSMAIARAYHTATLLTTDEVLVVGTTNDTPAVGELYNPASGTWRPTGTVTGARQGHTATLLPTGQVLIAGGDNTRATELYDAVADRFNLSVNLVYQRQFHTATRLGNGSVLLAGGNYDAATAELRTSAVVLTSLAVTGPSTVHVGDSANYRATGTFSDGTTTDITRLVIWTASPSSIAGGGTFGGIQANGTGTATITASYGAVTTSVSLVATQTPTSTINGTTVTGLTHVRQQGATATRLTSGQVLLAGGIDNGGVTASAELYDPATGVFSVTGSLATARYYHTATLLPDGRVLVTGGYSATTPLDTAEIFNPDTGNWTTVPMTMSSARSYHTATLVGTRVLVAGGVGTNALRGAELFDPATATFSAVGNMTVPRYLHTATLLPDGRVLVAGGYSASGEQATAELYDPGSATWAATASMTIPRTYHTATLLTTNEVLVAGTTSFSSVAGELYNPTTGTWRLTGTPSRASQGSSATLLETGQVLIAGTNGFSTTELYDPIADQFTVSSNMAYGRNFHTATRLADGSVLLAGGDFNATAELRTPSVVLTGLTVTPASATIPVGGHSNYRAIGTFSDGTTADITNVVTWTVSSSAVAAGGAFGSVQAVGVGTATITASTGSVTAGATLVVQ